MDVDHFCFAFVFFAVFAYAAYTLVCWGRLGGAGPVGPLCLARSAHTQGAMGDAVAFFLGRVAPTGLCQRNRKEKSSVLKSRGKADVGLSRHFFVPRVCKLGALLLALFSQFCISMLLHCRCLCIYLCWGRLSVGRWTLLYSARSTQYVSAYEYASYTLLLREAQ